MTIKRFIRKISAGGKKGRVILDPPDGMVNMYLDMTDVWSNGACLGYVIQAMENLGYFGEDITAVQSEIIRLFDDVSVDEAEEIYTG